MTGIDESIPTMNDRGISDYLLEATELRQLRLEVIQLKSDLAIANAKASFYEDQAGSIQEILKGALRTAFEIKQNAEKQAREITDQAEEEKRDLQEEIASLSAERDKVRAELAELQGSLGHAQQLRNELNTEREQLRSDLDAMDLRLRAIRAAFDVASASASHILTSGENQAPPINIPTSEATVITEDAQETLPVDQPSETLHTVPADKPGESVETLPEDQPSDITTVPYGEDGAASSVVEVEVKSGFSGTNGSNVSNGADNARSTRRRLNLADFLSTKPGNDIELVVSSLHGFPKLVEFERALHEFAEIKNFYVRDFRNGIARLVIRLKDPNQRQELQNRLECLPGWKMSVTSSEPSKIEMKVTT